MHKRFQLQVYSVDKEEDVMDRMGHIDGIA